MYIIRKLWIDLVEDNYGYKVIGYVNNKEKADIICSFKHFLKDDPKLRNYLNCYADDHIPMFTSQKIKCLDDISFSELNEYDIDNDDDYKRYFVGYSPKLL